MSIPWSEDSMLHAYKLAPKLTKFEEPRRFNAEEQFKQLMFEAIKHDCSDVLIQPNTPVLALIRGHLKALTNRKIDVSEVMTIIEWASGRPTAKTDIVSGRPVDSRYEVFDQENNKNERGEVLRYAFRVNISGINDSGTSAAQIVMRTIPNDPPTYDRVGLTEDFIVEHCTPENGIVLVAGKTGSGKSTTFAAVLRYILENPTPIQGNIITSEQPIEYTYSNIVSKHSVIVQSEVPKHISDFSKANEAAMRRHPALAMIGELRDSSTIMSAVELSLTGHPVFGTVHSGTVSTVIKRLVSRFPESEQSMAISDLIETLRCIIAQQLVPKADGKGLIAVREYLKFDEEVRNRLYKLSSMTQLTDAIQKIVHEKKQSFAHIADDLEAKGVITEHVATRLRISAGVDVSIKEEIPVTEE